MRPFKIGKAFSTLLMIFISIASYAEQKQLDANSEKALEETRKLLTNPALRDQEVRKDAGAVQADQNVDRITGGGTRKEEVYQISADIMADLARKTGGDSAKMLQLVEKAKANPEEFFRSLSPEQQEKIHGLSQRLPSSQQQAAPPQ